MRHALWQSVTTLVGGVVLVLSGCGGGTPTSPEQCAAMSKPAARDECYLVVAPAVFKADPQAGITLVETGISDPLTRDMAWYNVTTKVDPYSTKYCERIQDQTLAKRCGDIVSRPHLHRELTGTGGGPPGGGPPGGGDRSPPPNRAPPP